MTDKIFHGSLARISDLGEVPFQCQLLPRQAWEVGDYVVGEVTVPRAGLSTVELTSGRAIQAVDGDSVLGALGVRHATMEIVGSWEAVTEDGRMDLLTAAGLIGRATSISGMLGAPMRLAYRGHAVRNGIKLRMSDFAKAPSAPGTYGIPTILVIGTSMSAGKTTWKGSWCSSM